MATRATYKSYRVIVITADITADENITNLHESPYDFLANGDEDARKKAKAYFLKVQRGRPYAWIESLQDTTSNSKRSIPHPEHTLERRPSEPPSAA